MRAILMFHNCEGQSHKTVSTDHNFYRPLHDQLKYAPQSSSIHDLRLFGRLGQKSNNNNNNSYIARYPVKIYKLAALYIINIKIRLTINNNNNNNKVQVL